MKLTFVNVGYGEAMVLECPSPAARGGVFVMVIDGGSGEAAEFAQSTSGRIPLADALIRRGLDHIDVMVNTHIHEDHTCGLLPAARMLPPGELWQTLPSEGWKRMHLLDTALAQTPSQEKFLRAINDYQQLCALTERCGGAVRTVTQGDGGELCPGLRYRVLAPGEAACDQLVSRCRDLFAEEDPAAARRKLSALDARMNNFSLMLRLEYQGTRILLPGDTNREGYDGLEPAQLRADLFKVGHHGQQDGASPELLAAVRPKAVVCCASSDRRYNSAHPDTLRRIADGGADLYFSDCPQVPGITDGLPPHESLTFTIGPAGALSAAYETGK